MEQSTTSYKQRPLFVWHMFVKLCQGERMLNHHFVSFIFLPFFFHHSAFSSLIFLPSSSLVLPSHFCYKWLDWIFLPLPFMVGHSVKMRRGRKMEGKREREKEWKRAGRRMEERAGRRMERGDSYLEASDRRRAGQCLRLNHEDRTKSLLFYQKPGSALN